MNGRGGKKGEGSLPALIYLMFCYRTSIAEKKKKRVFVGRKKAGGFIPSSGLPQKRNGTEGAFGERIVSNKRRRPANQEEKRGKGGRKEGYYRPISALSKKQSSHDFNFPHWMWNREGGGKEFRPFVRHMGLDSHHHRYQSIVPDRRGKREGRTRVLTLLARLKAPIYGGQLKQGGGKGGGNNVRNPSGIRPHPAYIRHSPAR